MDFPISLSGAALVLSRHVTLRELRSAILQGALLLLTWPVFKGGSKVETGVIFGCNLGRARASRAHPKLHLKISPVDPLL